MTRPGSTGRSAGTPRSRTGSRAGGSTRPARRSCSGSPPRCRWRRVSPARWPGTGRAARRERDGGRGPPESGTHLARPGGGCRCAARGRRGRGDRRLPGPGHGRALLLGEPQRLADVPGGRPDLARHRGVAPREGDDGLRPHRPRLADAPRAAHVDHGIELGAAPAADDRAAGRRARPDRDARGLRHRRPPRGPSRRRVVRCGVRGRAVRRDPLLRPALPRLVGRPVPPAGARADAAGRLSLGRRRARLGRVHRPRASRLRVPRSGARGDVRGRRARVQAGQRAVPRRAARGVRARPSLDAPAALPRVAGSGASRAHALEGPRPRRGAALRPGGGDPARGGARRPGHGVRHQLARPHGAPRPRHVAREHVEHPRVHVERARAAVPARWRERSPSPAGPSPRRGSS